MGNIWFTADTHFGHANIIIYTKRPWLSKDDLNSNGKWKDNDIKKTRRREMDEALIDNWNEYVKPKDVVYHLGDFAFVTKCELINRYLDRLNGKIYLILGNHDNKQWCKRSKFYWVSDKYQGKMIKIHGQCIFLFHTRCDVWDLSHHGSWHLFGHSHGTLPVNKNKLSMDVGVDANDYKPISIDEVITEMEKREFTPIKERK